MGTKTRLRELAISLGVEVTATTKLRMAVDIFGVDATRREFAA